MFRKIIAGFIGIAFLAATPLQAQTIGPSPPATGSGTVTSVGISPPSIMTAGAPVTTTGNVSLSLNSQSANQVLIAPNGSAGTPTFRSLVTADLPAIATQAGSQTANTIWAAPNGSAGNPAFRTLAPGDFPNDITIGNYGTKLTDSNLQYSSVQVFGQSGFVGGNVAVLGFSNDQSASFYGCFKNRQTTKGTGGVAVIAGDNTCELNANAWDGLHYNTHGTLDWSVDGAVSVGDVPTNFAVWNGGFSTSGVSGNTLGFLIDGHANAYFRNGYVGIGSSFGYNPPAVYSAGAAPPYPLSIAEGTAGTYIAAYYAGSTGGGAQIQASNGFSSTVPIYGFWFNNTSGIGNPAANVTSIITGGGESARVDASGNLLVGTTSAVAKLAVNGSFATSAPTFTSASSYSVVGGDSTVVFTPSANATITLPAASGATGRLIRVTVRAAFTVSSASTNIIPLAGGAATTAILSATAGKWALLQSDGTNWNIIEGN